MAELLGFVLYSIGSFTLFFFIGKAAGKREEKSKKPKPITPTCPCAHTVGEHKDGGLCKAQVLRPYYRPLGDRNGHQYVQCPCTKYSGPVVVTNDFFNPGTYAP